MDLLDLELIKSIFGELFHQQITHYTFAFIIAWKIVKRDMRKDMAVQFTNVTASIDAVAKALEHVRVTVALDLKAHAARLNTIEHSVNKISSRMDLLEKKP